MGDSYFKIQGLKIGINRQSLFYVKKLCYTYVNIFWRGKCMKLYAACMSCLLSGQEKRIRDYQNEDEKAEYMKELMRLIVNSTEETCAPWLAAQIEKVYEKYFGKNGDYKSIK